MNDLWHLAFALGMGLLLGAFFFGGLWWTVRNSLSAKHAALLFLGSMLVRSFIVLLGFYFVLGSSWQRLLAGLLGFIVARVLVTRLTKAQPDKLAQESCRAP